MGSHQEDMCPALARVSQMCSPRRTGCALSVILHFWHSSMLGRSAEVFHACRDLSGSKGLSCCSGQLCPVVWLLKFSN